MRSLARALHNELNMLSEQAPPDVRRTELEELCLVELGLHLQQTWMPHSPAAQAWVLFSGYPYAAASGVPLPPDAEHVRWTVRHALWALCRPRAWHEALERYQRHIDPLRGFDVTDLDQPAVRRPLSVALDRWSVYDALLYKAPPLVGRRPEPAGTGPHAFSMGRSLPVVNLPPAPSAPLIAHDVDTPPPGGGEPLTFRLADLEETAAAMDVRQPGRNWVRTLRSFDLSTRTAEGFGRSDRFTVEGIQHLLGIVGAGKSTLRDIIAVHLATVCAKKVTIVVTDVPEVLKLVQLYNIHTDGAAAPVLGASGKERHAQRLHRRLAGRGEHRLLAHDDPAFDHLSTACTVNTLLSAGQVLTFGEAPCADLRPPRRRTAGEDEPRQWRKTPVSCPYWPTCPRHHSARELVRADIWVSTPAGLLDARPPLPQNGERIRYLELACRRSDLVIVDEADRVQMQLDQAFAPAVLLARSDREDGFIDELSGHRIRELAAGGRTQLSDRDVETFTAALSTAETATNRLYAMLVSDHALRRRVRTGYFSAWTLQTGLLDERDALLERAGNPEVPVARQDLRNLLDAFRDNPFGDRSRPLSEHVANLIGLLSELLHTSNPDRTAQRMRTAADKLFALEPCMAVKRKEYARKLAEWERRKVHPRPAGRKRKAARPETPEEWRSGFLKRFEFTLLLSALEPKLALVNAMWSRVEAALNLRHNSMYRRPDDYGPVVPEAPMGNVLGFQFHVPGEDEGGVRSGELRFFRCSGVGRELLRAMPRLSTVDGLPGTHVLLMSGSSWAGKSSRYHIPVAVGVIIEPPPEVIGRIEAESRMRFEFIEDEGETLRISGSERESRREKLRRIATWLGASFDEELHGGPLERELLTAGDKRDQILLLVGSYDEARVVADTLHNLNMRWKDRVLRLVSDDEDIEEGPGDGGNCARVLRRGDVEHLKDGRADVLVAPLLAVERGHNILNESAEAAISTVYFLARPNPHPDDLALAVHAINDWIVRAVDGGEFAAWVGAAPSLTEGAQEVRRLARSQWYRVLRRSMAWSRLGDDREQVTWDMLVLVWQVVGRLVRGGVPARVVFVDSAFAPNRAATPPRPDDHKSSLLHSMQHVLRPYFTNAAGVSPHDRYIARALYAPLWAMLDRCLRS
ncbi:hypothetical protein ACIBK8_30470 [Streptomyces sp. NPDC050161]|uniref:pPIWI_RE_Z domain-containing protein n=1 Tax=Streptomyces sp. NPDC050161 TaxID=3365604 RepID=UPI0037BD8B29